MKILITILLVVQAAPPHPTQTVTAAHGPVVMQGRTQAHNIRVLSLPPKDWADWLTLMSAVALAAAGVIGVIYAYRTLRAIEDQTESARITKEGMQAVERAYVAFPIMGAFVEPVTNASGAIQEWKIALPVKNTGHTPAKDLTVVGNWHRCPDELPDDFDFPDYDISKIARFDLPSGELIYTGDLTIPHDVILSVIAKTSHLYYYGWATYRDVFDNSREHRTDFCHKVVLTGFSADKLVGNRIFHRSHNTHT